MRILQAPSETSAASSAHALERGHLAPSPTLLSAVEIPGLVVQAADKCLPPADQRAVLQRFAGFEF